jgi:hypothetical protein
LDRGLLQFASEAAMTVDARPVTPHPHPSHEREDTEGASSLLADDANELPHDADELELPPDVELQPDGPAEEVTWEDDMEPDQGEHEVEDTPGDDALIASARIARFDEAHRGAAPVDVGPWDVRGQGTTDDASVAAVEDYTLRGKMPGPDE